MDVKECGSSRGWCLVILNGVALAVAGPWAAAAEGGGLARPSWGTDTVHTAAIHSVGFHLDMDWQGWTSVDVALEGRELNAEPTPGTFHAPLMLLSGALVLQIELDACDDSPTKDIVSAIVSETWRPRETQVEGIAATIDQQGCQQTIAVTPGLVIDNRQHSGLLRVALNAEYETRFKAMRVR